MRFGKSVVLLHTHIHTHILSFQFAKTHCSMFYILQLKRLMKTTQYSEADLSGSHYS